MTKPDTSREIEWPREIWASERVEQEPDGHYVVSEHATIPRWQGDRDCEYQRYVDGDIYDSAEKYWRERAEKAEAALSEAQLEATSNNPVRRQLDRRAAQEDAKAQIAEARNDALREAADTALTFVGEYEDAEGDAALLIRSTILALIAAPDPAPPSAQGERHSTRHEAREAAKVLLRCNGMDIDNWSYGIWPDDVYTDALRALAGIDQERET